MKKINIVIIISVAVLCIIGWGSIIGTKVSDSAEYLTSVKQADEWMEQGLYQRAIEKYESAHNEKASQELYEKIDAAYVLRCEEAHDETIDDYVKFLEGAVKKYPASKTLVDHYVEQCAINEDYQAIYDCLSNAIKNGYDTKENQKKLKEVRYYYELQTTQFAAMKNSENEVYTVGRNSNNKWNLYSLDDGYLLENDCDFISQCNKDGIYVVTNEKDSRLLDLDGFVMGIFEKKVTDAGIYSEGLIPVNINNKYGYYDEFAQLQFGDYQMAGTFQDGLAAVQTKEGWILVDNKGKKQSSVYEEIVIDDLGRYLVNDTILAKAKGKYGLYDEKFKLICEIDCTDVDILAGDELIAVCKGNKWGYVNTSGEMVIEPKYEAAKSFSNGLGAVCVNGDWGFINPENEIVIKCSFVEAGYFNDDGICIIRNDQGESNEDVSDTETDFEEADIEDNDEEIVDSEYVEDDITQESSDIEEETNEEELELLEIWMLLKLELGIIED